MKLRTLFGLVGPAVVGLLAAIPSPAFGAPFSRYYHPSFCQTASGTPTLANGRIQNLATTNLVLWCPIQRDVPPTGTPPNITLVTVDGYCATNTPNCTAYVCVSHRVGGAETRDFGGNNVSGMGVFHLSPGLLVPSEYFYIQVTLSPGSALFGYIAAQAP